MPKRVDLDTILDLPASIASKITRVEMSGYIFRVPGAAVDVHCDTDQEAADLILHLLRAGLKAGA